MKNALKNITASLTLITVVTITYAQDASYGWTRTAGVSSYNSANSNDHDAQGNIYETGQFNGTVDFDPGPGTFNMTHSNGSSYARKLDPAGNMIWAIQFGSANCYPASLRLNAAGQIFIAGIFSGTGDFNPGSGINNLSSAAGSEDGFIIKVDNNGQSLLAVKFGGTNIDRVHNMIVTPSGVFCTGLFFGTGDYDPGAGVFNLTASGSHDIYVLKLDDNLAFQWAAKYGSASDDAGMALAADANSLIVTGFFSNTVDFDAGSGTYNVTSNGGYDVFVLKLNLITGAFINTVNIGTNLSERSRAATVDNSGDIYIAGEFSNTMDFNPGAATNNLTSNGAADAFVLKLNTNLTYINAVSFGGISGDNIYALDTDAAGNIYAAGYFTETVDMDPGAGIHTVTTAGNDLFVSKFNSSLTYQWSKETASADSNSFSIAFGISVDGNGNIAVAGWIGGTVDCNPGIAVDLQSTSATTAMMELYLPYCAYTYATFNYIVCDSFAFNSNTYSASGVYVDTLMNAAGCDSIVTLNLTVLGNSFFNTMSASACDSFQWHNNTYYSSGVYHDSLTTTTGCDSIYELILTVNNSSATTLNLSGCDSVNWDILTFTTSGWGIYTFTNIAGCDSNVTVYVTVYPHADTTVTYTNWPLDLMSNQSNGTYQWINCTTGQPVIGATQQNFVPAANGDYAVIVANANGCSDTSACYTVTSVGMEESQSAMVFEIFPNPAGENIALTMRKQDTYAVEIVSVSGGVVESFRFTGSNHTIDVANYSAGVYSVVVTSSEGATSRSLLVKE